MAPPLRWVAVLLGCALGVVADPECQGGECDVSSLLAINVKKADNRPRHHRGGGHHLPPHVQLVKGDAAHCTHHGVVEVEAVEAGTAVTGIVTALQDLPASPEGALGCHRDHGCIPEPPEGVHWDCHSQECIVPDSWTCERGTEDDCRASGAFWTGRRCCFDKRMECAAGLSRDCDGDGMKWTGRKCCVCSEHNPVHATAGTKNKCTENGGRWTGTYCFVTAPRTQCDIGIESDCQHAGGIFTGFMCCVDNKWDCGAGSGNSCAGPAQAWTGFLCCQKDPNKQCVAGMKNECERGCGGPPITWTGSKCCVPDTFTCTAGSAKGCEGPDRFWTGTLCCSKHPATCTGGREDDCVAGGGMWTGSRCCLRHRPYTCTAGTQNGCVNPHSTWVGGGRCCVTGRQYCKASIERHCFGRETVFTGSQCCVPQDWICELRGTGECGPGESSVGCKCCRPPGPVPT